jgi:hypothetical protein
MTILINESPLDNIFLEESIRNDWIGPGKKQLSLLSKSMYNVLKEPTFHRDQGVPE